MEPIDIAKLLNEANPDTISPISLMKLVKIDQPTEATAKIPADKLWVEPKWDGYLVQIIYQESAYIYTRNGIDKTANFPTLTKELDTLGITGSMLIGELIWFEKGQQSITKISSIVGSSQEESIRKQKSPDGYVAIVLYDILWHNGQQITDQPFKDRRKLLEKIVKPHASKTIILSPTYPFTNWKKAAKDSIASGGEGIVIKNIDSKYTYSDIDQREPRPANTWWKWKPPQKARTDDFVVYDQRHTDKGTLMVDFGQYIGDKIHHVGSIDSFSGDVQRQITSMKGEPFVIEVGFEERTADGKLRHPHFIRIRDDKSPKDAQLPPEYQSTLEIIESKDYPEHPDTILIKNSYYPKGLTEHMVWRHNLNHKKDLYDALKGKKALIIIKTDHGDILRRHDKEGEYEVHHKDDIDRMNSGRAMEFHIVANDTTDTAWIDLDPQDKFPYDQLKQITKDAADIMDRTIGGKITIKYSGGRGFHILTKLTKDQKTDQLREDLTKALDKYATKNPKLTTKITKDPESMRLDVSTLHTTGSIRATWSLNAKTGLASVPLTINDLDSFEKDMATIVIPQAQIEHPFKEDPNSTEGQMRWRLRDPDGYIPNSITTWKYYNDNHDDGITYIVGQLQKPYGETAVQAIRFDRSKWDQQSADKWWQEHQLEFDKVWTDKDWKKRGYTVKESFDLKLSEAIDRYFDCCP